MTTVTIHEAKTHLSRLIQEALAGGDVTITRGRSGEELVKLVPAKPVAAKRRVPGRLAHLLPPGKDPLEDGFWDPLPDDELALWNGESLPTDPTR
jgi:prevent-host-death family protein